MRNARPLIPKKVTASLERSGRTRLASLAAAAEVWIGDTALSGLKDKGLTALRRDRSQLREWGALAVATGAVSAERLQNAVSFFGRGV